MKKILNKYKYLIITLLIISFQSLCYFIGKLFINKSPHFMHSKFDDVIPYISAFIIFYILWYLMLVLCPLIIKKYNKSAFYKYSLCLIINAIISLIVFIIFPTSIIRYGEIGNTIFDELVKLIYYFDTPTTCLPSMHASACFIALYFAISTKEVPKKYRVGITITSILIILSTLFIKQHVLYDLFASFIITIFIYIGVKKSKKYFTF